MNVVKFSAFCGNGTFKRCLRVDDKEQCFLLFI